MTLDEFLDRYPVRVPVDRDDCWAWLGGTAGNYKGRLRYGRVKLGGRAQYVHRVVYELANGPIRPGMHLVRNIDVCHSDERCCNPAHWMAVLARTKTKVFAKQGRASRGIRHALAVAVGKRQVSLKLNIEKAREIRASAEPARVVAQRYGIHESMVWRIRRGECWAEATPFSGLVA